MFVPEKRSGHEATSSSSSIDRSIRIKQSLDQKIQRSHHSEKCLGRALVSTREKSGGHNTTNWDPLCSRVQCVGELLHRDLGQRGPEGESKSSGEEVAILASHPRTCPSGEAREHAPIQI